VPDTPAPKHSGPKILFIDIETSPHTAHVWQLFDVHVSPNQIMATGETMCVAAKWRDDRTVQFRSTHRDGADEMLRWIHGLLDEADIVVGYNSIKFDLPILRKDFLLAGLEPPSPFKHVDLLRTMRSTFKFPSNKLGVVTERLGLGGKVTHAGHQLWVDCMAGDEKAWRKMTAYNRNDVVILERLYERLLPWIPNHPNMGLWKGGHTCPNCGSGELQSRGTARTTTRVYRRFQCNSCGKWSRAVKADKDSAVEVVAA
jgi:DNA polymerase elongation subunit (family B)